MYLCSVLRGVFSISYESPKSILSLATIDFLDTLLFKRERKRAETWKGKEKKDERKKNGRSERKKLDTSNGCAGYILAISKSADHGIGIKSRAKSRDRHRSYRLILPGPLSRSVDSSMNDRCSFTVAFLAHFLTTLLALYSNSFPDFSISSSRIEKFSFNLNYRRILYNDPIHFLWSKNKNNYYIIICKRYNN